MLSPKREKNSLVVMIFMALRRDSCCGVYRHLVYASPSCSALGMYSKRKLPEWHCCRRKCVRIPMWRQRRWSTWFKDCLMVDWLSHFSGTARGACMRISVNRFLRNAASLAASAAAIHSDSLVLWATRGCRWCEYFQLSRLLDAVRLRRKLFGVVLACQDGLGCPNLETHLPSQRHGIRNRA